MSQCALIAPKVAYRVSTMMNVLNVRKITNFRIIYAKKVDLTP